MLLTWIGHQLHWQGNTILVDTPGIGGSDEETKKMMEYLSNAVSFIFVINVASGGGMMNDRVSYDPLFQI